MNPRPSTSRRRFLQSTASALTAAPFILRGQSSPNSKLQHASFGSAGMAGGDLRKLAGHPDVELVAVAEIDLSRADKVRAEFPDCRIYQDWRELLETEGDRVDCCNVSTPDHMHAPISMSAIHLGKHVYCQKPLTHDVYESRQLQKVAAEAQVVTQMGTQLASSTPDMTVENWIQKGLIGKVKEVHTFSHKTWGDPKPRPEGSDPAPDTLDWDGWNGVVEPVPYLKGHYHPSQWRKRISFGTGTLGDMGCHMFNGWFRAMALTSPIAIQSTGPAPNAHNWAVDGEIHYTYPGNEFTAGDTLKVVWYDGANRPPQDLIDRMPRNIKMESTFPKQGSVYVGETGILVHAHGGPLTYLPDGKFAPDVITPKEVQGSSDDHWKEFIDAILDRTDGKKPKSNFDFAGPMTESVLLGNIASFFPEKVLQWDSAALKFTNEPGANKWVKQKYREEYGPGRFA